MYNFRKGHLGQVGSYWQRLVETEKVDGIERRFTDCEENLGGIPR